MLTYKKGDLFASTEGAIAHGCNCQGVMGSGVAKIVKEKFPEAYKKYNDLCSSLSSKSLLGRAQEIYIESRGSFLYNIFTQDMYGSLVKRYVSYDAISDGFLSMFDHMNQTNQNIVNIPKIGAGLGRGEWDIIESIIISSLKCYPDIRVVVWEL